MAFWNRKPAPEKRGSFDVADVPVSASDFVVRMGWDQIIGATAGISVTTERALQVPAVAAAVNFLSGTLASLPLDIMQVTPEGKQAVQNGLSVILHDAPNDDQTSYAWRKAKFDAVFTGGRGCSYIERDGAGLVKNIWPFDPKTVTVKRIDGRKVYEVRDGKVKTYAAAEVIDITFMDHSDMLRHRSPIVMGRDAIAMAIAATQYGSKAFQSGGVPPVVLEGPFQTGAAAQRASDDVATAMRQLADKGNSVLTIPTGHTMKPLGFNPKDMQLLELQMFCVEQIARLYALPPVFLQDLTHATFSNNEQQDLHLTKHTLHHWVKQFEQELTLKLFGRDPRFKVEMNMDGLLRGDIATRMAAHATAIQNGIYSPAHAALIEDQPVRKEGDILLVQGAMVPIGSNGAPAKSSGTNAGAGNGE
jgi:HK97 family phage portal protein